MVDYTKKEMRDETWRRWKGGAKLAAELAAFYTAKRATNRIAANNPTFSGSPGGNGALQSKGHQERINALLAKSPGARWLGARPKVAAFFGVSPKEEAANNPGQDPPVR